MTSKVFHIRVSGRVIRSSLISILQLKPLVVGENVRREATRVKPDQAPYRDLRQAQ